MTVAGLCILMYNAVAYFMKWHIGIPALTIFGLIFVAVGLKLAKNST